jgi:hypothetical protein
MSKYAKINSENIVENIILCEDSQIGTQPGVHIKVTNETNEPVQGFEYNLEKNKFTSPQPYESWTLNADTLVWECPDGPKPTDGFYRWNEETLKWETLS